MSPEKGPTRAIVYIHAGWYIRQVSAVRSSCPHVVIFIFHLHHHVVDCSSSIIPIVLVTKYASSVTLGLGRGNWFSFVQSPVEQTLRTRGRFMYCAKNNNLSTFILKPRLISRHGVHCERSTDPNICCFLETGCL